MDSLKGEEHLKMPRKSISSAAIKAKIGFPTDIPIIEWSIWTAALLILLALTINDLVTLVKDYRENEPVTNTDIMRNNSLTFPNLTICARVPYSTEDISLNELLQGELQEESVVIGQSLAIFSILNHMDKEFFKCAFQRKSFADFSYIIDNSSLAQLEAQPEKLKQLAQIVATHLCRILNPRQKLVEKIGGYFVEKTFGNGSFCTDLTIFLSKEYFCFDLPLTFNKDTSNFTLYFDNMEQKWPVLPYLNDMNEEIKEAELSLMLNTQSNNKIFNNSYNSIYNINIERRRRDTQDEGPTIDPPSGSEVVGSEVFEFKKLDGSFSDASSFVLPLPNQGPNVNGNMEESALNYITVFLGTNFQHLIGELDLTSKAWLRFSHQKPIVAGVAISGQYVPVIEKDTPCRDQPQPLCEITCKTEAIKHFCGCWPFSMRHIMPNVSGLNFCTFEQYFNCSNIVNPRWNFSRQFDVCAEQCKNPCVFTIYEAEKDIVPPHPDGMAFMTLEPMRLIFPRHVQRRPLTAQAFASQVGGILGLYLGASGLTAFMLLISLWKWIQKLKTQRKRTAFQGPQMATFLLYNAIRDRTLSKKAPSEQHADIEKGRSDLLTSEKRNLRERKMSV